jgi:hypothetical protein
MLPHDFEHFPLEILVCGRAWNLESIQKRRHWFGRTQRRGNRFCIAGATGEERNNHEKGY